MVWPLTSAEHRTTGPGWTVRLALSQRFHALAARLPLLRLLVRREGAALFDLVQGFVKSQVLMALVDTGVLDRLSQRPAPLDRIAQAAGLDPARAAVLMQAGRALGLLRLRGEIWHLTPRGAAFLAVPGLRAMVQHHRVLYADLSDPAALFRGETAPALARFWPYVFGEARQVDPEMALRYSQLMADSQALVAEDTLRLVRLDGVRHLMDVGGGTGRFLAEVARRAPGLDLTLVDLPQVVAGAQAPAMRPGRRFAVHGADFRADPLPSGCDAISLVRVLYDHDDATVRALLAACHAALPPGGRLIVSEPMSGGAQSDPATDVYFAVYTMAMGTGRTRSAAEIGGLLSQAGFSAISTRSGARPFVTSVVEARRPGQGGPASVSC